MIEKVRNIKLDLLELLTPENLPKNETIRDNFIKAYKIVNDPKYHNILCSISGGSDSDIVLDIIHKVDINRKVKYVWFDTGLEYDATKRHLEYLENRYAIEIIKIRAKTPIPLSCKKYGQPFISKIVSKNIESLQRYNFDFSKETDNDYIRMIKKYCIAHDHKIKNAVEIDGKWYSGCVGAILWWCNVQEKLPWGTDLSFNIKFCISRNTWLKEFMIENPPTFSISNKCCNYAKKSPSHDFIRDNNIDLLILGIRKAEGGYVLLFIKIAMIPIELIMTSIDLFFGTQMRISCVMKNVVILYILTAIKFGNSQEQDVVVAHIHKTLNMN